MIKGKRKYTRDINKWYYSISEQGRILIFSEARE